MKYIDQMFLVRQAHAMRAHAEIVSGAYKAAHITRGGIPITDEEKLLDKIAEMKRHIDLMQEIADNAYEANKAK